MNSEQRSKHPCGFWEGFDGKMIDDKLRAMKGKTMLCKQAGNPLLGTMPGIKSGISGKMGRLPAARPTSGVSIAARSTPVPLPTPKPVALKTPQASIPQSKLPSVTTPKPTGASSTQI